MTKILMRRRTLLCLILAGIAMLAGLTYVKLAGDLPAPDALITSASPDATKIYDRHGHLLYEILDPRAGRRTRVPLKDMPLALREAVISVEDASFYQNPGVDYVGIVRAALSNLRAGQIIAGGSTITQQLARELLLSKEERETRSYTRKLREAILALRLTQAYSKDQILEMYLNEVYFGQLAYGVEAAAHTYFDKSARDLDLAEAALLAGLIQSPYAYNPLVDLDAARARQRVVLGLMVKNGMIPDSDAALAEAEPLHFASPATATPLRAPHFVTYIRSLLEEQYGAQTVNHGGLQVVTTLDLDLQERAQSIVQDQLADLTRRTREEGTPDFNVHDAALVAIDPATGEILAMVGSADYFDESIEGAVNVALANRQPGSAIKPITYATAFGRDLSPASVFSDVPTSFLTKEGEPYQPQNYDQTWHGPISLRQALATSSNMVAVKVLDHVGLDSMIETAKALGISTFDDSDRFGLALTLGGGEVKLLELTAAYAGLANAGRRVTPVGILSVNGRAWTRAGMGPAAVSPQVAYLVTSVLSDDSARIPAFGEDSVLKLYRPAAAKTGTTTDFRDNWTIGYTPDLVTGVWVGNADNSPMYKTSGITGAGPIWHDFMEEALKNKPTHGFVRPPGLADVEICDSSGLLATDLCPRRRTELFVAGTEPLRRDDSYQPVPVDSSTGLLWADGCRGPETKEVYWILPPDAQEWGRKQGIPAPPTMDCKLQARGPAVVAFAEPLGSNSGSELKVGAVPKGARPATDSKLAITNPPPNSVFALAPQLPLELQQVEVSARPNAAVTIRELTLTVDGRVLATLSQPPYRVLWQLAAGAHTVLAIGVDAEGNRFESEPVQFSVEDNP